MTLDKNSLPKDLRPINVGRTVSEEPRVLPATTTGRNPDSFPPTSVASRGVAPVFYTTTVSDPGFVSLGYGNAAGIGAAAWCTHMPVQIGHPVVSHPATGYGYTQNIGNWVGGCNGADPAAGTGYTADLSNFAGSSGVDHAGNDVGSGIVSTPLLSTRASGNATDQTGNVQANWAACSNTAANRKAGNGVDQVNDDGDDSVSWKKIKFLCSFGGKIMPRLSDGMLRYVGGHTRIISVRRDVSFNELVQKMANTYGQATVIKYQLPDEDLDALVSISCPDDLDNMMEEYEKLVERTSYGSAKLRVFLFSPSEVDPSGMTQFVDLRDSGQKYVNAVNGFADGFGGGLTRRGSMTSAASMQNSDFSGSEAPEHSVHGQGDGIKAAPSPSMLSPGATPSSLMLSPRENALTSHDSSTKIEAVSTVCSDVLGVPVGTTGTKICLNQASPLQPEIETERSVSLTSPQQHIGLQQSSTEIPLLASYLNPFAPNPEVMNHAEYIQFPSQVGFPPCQHLDGGSVFTQQQIFDNTSPSSNFIPAMQVPVTPSSSHASMRSNTVCPLVQPQQNQLDPYAHESTFGSRIMPLHAEHSYYQFQVPSSVVGSGYGWYHTPPTEHASVHDGLVAHQQERIPLKPQRLEDCLVCQKALPHAHSDTVAQDKRDNDMCSVPNIAPVFHSVHLGDHMISPCINGVMLTDPLGESIIEQGVRIQPRVTNNVDPLVSAQTDTRRQAHNLEWPGEGERSFIQKPHVSNYHRNAVDMVGRVVDIQSPHGAFVCNMPQSNQDDVVRKIISPAGNHVKGDSLATKPTIDDMSPPGTTTKVTQNVVQESPEARANKLPEFVSRGEVADNHFTYDQLKPIDGRMEMLRMHNPEGYVHNKHINLPFDNTTKGDNSCCLPNQVVGKEMFLDNDYERSKMVSEVNQLKTTDILPSSSAGVPFVHNSKPMESSELGTSVWSNPLSYSQSIIGNRPLDCNFIKPSFYGVDPANITVHPADWSNHIARFDKATTSAAEVLSCSGNAPTAISPSGRPGDVEDTSSSLFSDKEPWNLQCNNYYPSPRPSKVQLLKEPVVSVDPFRDNQLGKQGKQNLDGKPGDGLFQSLTSSKQDLRLEQSVSAKAEEKTKQELQADAEGVAATVSHSSVPSSTDLLDRNDTLREEIVVENVQNIAPDKQRKGNIQDATTTSDNVQLGLQRLDGIGRLQIIKNSDLEELRELGSGTFGTVYHGKWRGTDVAIKRINDRCFAGKPSEQERMRDDFWNEAIKLADLHHPNVVAFYGVVLDGTGGSVATVTEYMVNGSLRTALLKNGRSLDMRKRLLIAMDMAFGMEYLHGKNIVHFDLKSDNLLVNLRDPHRPICKVGDLGLSKVKCQTLISGGVRGTLPWMAPELLNGSSSLVSEKVDVFSFGIVMWELLTGEEPYADLHYGAIIGGIVSNTLRPPVPESCDPGWRSLMERCWSPEPSDRPSFTEIVNELRSMAAKIPPRSQNLQQHPLSIQPQVQK